MKPIKTIRSKFSRFSKKMDNYQEALTFAQAGEYDHVNRLISHENTKKPTRQKLLVVGNGSTFPSHIVSYALEMAKRLSYEIVALNAAPVSEDQKEAFRSASEKNAEKFKRMAETAGVHLDHVVKFAAPDPAAIEVQRDKGGIDFVVSEETPELSAGQQDRRESRLSKECYVYSIT